METAIKTCLTLLPNILTHVLDDELENIIHNLITQDADQEVEAVLRKFTAIPRISIVDFFEETVPKYSHEEFIRFFRLQRTVFDTLADMYGNSKLYENVKSTAIGPKKSLAVFLWFAGHEAVSYRDISNLFNISLSTVHSIIYRTISFISCLAGEYIRWPSVLELEEESKHHEEKSGITGIIGAVDGTHITFQPGANVKDEYINRKGDFTIMMQAVCNSKRKFTHVSIGYPGRVHDARAFRASSLPAKLNALPTGYFLLGDAAYPCLKQLLTPYRDIGHLSAAQKNFNYKLSSCRIMIEHCFGILKQRFRQLYFCKLQNPKVLAHFIRACVVLHNLCGEEEIELLCNDDEPYEDNNNATDLDSIPDEVCESKAGRLLRDGICRSLRQKKSLRNI